MQAGPDGTVDTRVRILRTAADLFHRKGVRATSPGEIIKASGAGKGQFYHHFKNKDFLVHEVLRSFLEAVKNGRTPVRYEVKSWDDLENFFRSHIEFQRRFSMTRSCPIGTVANEANEGDEQIREDISLILDVMRNKLAMFFRGEKTKGRLQRDLEPEVVANFCIAAVQGAMLLGKVNRNSRPAEAAVHEALQHLKSYATRSNGEPRNGRTKLPSCTSKPVQLDLAR